MHEAVLLVILSAIHAINGVFMSIFPPYPMIGSIIVGFCFLLFLIYIIKSGLGQALKISFIVFVLLVVSSYFIGKIMKLLSITVSGS